MTKVVIDMTMSLDGFVAGPGASAIRQARAMADGKEAYASSIISVVPCFSGKSRQLTVRSRRT